MPRNHPHSKDMNWARRLLPSLKVYAKVSCDGTSVNRHCSKGPRMCNEHCRTEVYKGYGYCLEGAKEARKYAELNNIWPITRG